MKYLNKWSLWFKDDKKAYKTLVNIVFLDGFLGGLFFMILLVLIFYK